MSWHGPSDCGCCGCELFDFTDVFTAPSGTSTIDGFTVIDKKLPAGGLWYLELIPGFTGTATSTTPQWTFRLLKDDDSVFAEWSMGFYLKNDSYEQDAATTVNGVALVRTLDMDWNGTTFTDERVEPGSDSSISSTSHTFTATTRVTHQIAGRKECSTLFYNLTDSIENLAFQHQNSTGVFDSFEVPLRPYADSDTVSNKLQLFIAGVPIKNDSAAFQAAGALRLACKFNADPGTNTSTIGATAVKIYQEPVSCSDDIYTVSNDESFSLSERNVGCDWPVLCAVTAPHYSSPMWEVTSASSDLHQTDAGYGARNDCRSVCFFHNVALTTVVDSVPNAAPDVDVGETRIHGDIYPALFTHIALTTSTAPPTEHTCLVFKHTGGSKTDPANWSTGYALNFTGPPFQWAIETQVVATADPCRWKVTATIWIYGWTIGAALIPASNWRANISNAALGSLSTVFLTNPQTIDAFFGSKIVSPTFQPISWTFEQEVDAWKNAPPSITFSSANQTSTTSGSVYFLTEIKNPVVTVGGGGASLLFGVEGHGTEVTRSFPYSVTIGPRSTPRVPHP